MIRAYIVDDEAYSLNLIHIFLGRIDGLEIVGSTTDAYEALADVRRLRPDVVFLDIEMPGMSGIELAERIMNDQPDIHLIFVTAYDRYAIHAFEQGALDYLLKPLEMERLQKTMQRIRKIREAATAAEPSPAGRRADTAGIRMKIWLLGSFAAEGERNELLRFRTAKEKELFAYLAVHVGSRVHRDTIIDTLWPEDDPRRAKVYLHTCISLLRKDIKHAGFMEIVKYEDERYYLDPDRVAVDLAELQQLLASPRRDDPDTLVRMAQLYRGPLLDGSDYTWTAQMTAYVDISMAGLHAALLKHHMDRRDCIKATRLALRMLEDDAYSEEAYRALIRCYLDVGRREEASRMYRQFLRMADELRVQLSPEMRLLGKSFD